MGKIGPKFSHLLTVRAKGAAPPPFGQPDRKKTIFFDNFPYTLAKVQTNRAVKSKGAISRIQISHHITQVG